MGKGVIFSTAMHEEKSKNGYWVFDSFVLMKTLKISPSKSLHTLI